MKTGQRRRRLTLGGTLDQRVAWHCGRSASPALAKIVCGFPGSVFSFLKRDGHDPPIAERAIGDHGTLSYFPKLPGLSASGRPVISLFPLAFDL